MKSSTCEIRRYDRNRWMPERISKWKGTRDIEEDESGGIEYWKKKSLMTSKPLWGVLKLKYKVLDRLLVK